MTTNLGVEAGRARRKASATEARDLGMYLRTAKLSGAWARVQVVGPILGTTTFVQQSGTQNRPAPRFSLPECGQRLTVISIPGATHFSAYIHATRRIGRGTLWSKADSLN